jgi:hypothetical protein
MQPQRRAPSHEDQELYELQEALAALTVRVAEIRNRRPYTTERRRRSNTEPRPLSIGDRVYFKLNGHRVEGVVVGQTPHRFHIRHTHTGHIYLRSRNTITLIL